MSYFYSIGSALIKTGFIYPSALGLASSSGLISFNLPGSSPVNDELKQEATEIAKKMGIISKIRFYHANIACTTGSNLPWCNSAIYLGNENHKFHLVHELSHVRYNHLLVGSIFSCAATVGLSFAGLSLPMLVTAGAVSYFAYNLLWRHFEKSADLEACKHCSSREIAYMIRDIDSERFKNEISREGLVNGSLWEKINGYARYTSVGDNLLTLSSHALLIDHHPSYTSRMQYLKEAYYEKSGLDTITLRLGDNTESKGDAELDLPLSQTIIEKIRNSPKERSLIGTSLISFKPTEKNNLELYFKEGKPKIYTVSLDKIEELLVSDDKQKLILELIDEALNQPAFLNLSFDLNAEDENIKSYLEQLKKQFPSYDFDKFNITREPDSLFVSIPKR